MDSNGGMPSFHFSHIKENDILFLSNNETISVNLSMNSVVLNIYLFIYHLIIRFLYFAGMAGAIYIKGVAVTKYKRSGQKNLFYSRNLQN